MNYEEKALWFRRHIEKCLTPYIGCYTFANGAKSQAIAVIKNLAQPYPPTGTLVEGLEAVLYFPSPADQPVIGGMASEDEWVLHIKQHDSSRSTLPAKDAVLLGVPAQISSVFRNDADPLKNLPEICRIAFKVYSYLY